VTTSASGQMEIYGQDLAIPLTLPNANPPVPGEWLVSPPFNSAAAKAEQFLQSMGAPEGSLLERIIPCSVARQVFVLGVSDPDDNNFSIVPGEAYLFRLPIDTTGLSYTNPISPTPVVYPTCGPGPTNKYCISGTATEAGYSWWVDLGKDGQFYTTDPHNPIAFGATLGTSSVELANNLAINIGNEATSINNGVTVVAEDNCITITASKPFSLYVGPYGTSPPTCKVTSLGCTYNPIIWLDSWENSSGLGESPPLPRKHPEIR